MTPIDHSLSAASAHRRPAARLAVFVAILALASVLTGCASSVDTEKPVGIGTTPNTLKSSPCGCLLLPNAARMA